MTWVKAELQPDGTWTVSIQGGISPGHKSVGEALGQITHAMRVIEMKNKHASQEDEISRAMKESTP